MCVCVFFILFYLKNKLIAKHTHIFLITLLPNEERKWCDLAVFFLGLLKLYLPKLMRKQERKWRNGFWTKLAQQLATFSCLFFFFFCFFLFSDVHLLFIYLFLYFLYIFFLLIICFFFLFYIIIFLSLFLSFYIFYVLVLILYFLKRFYFIYFLRKKFWVFELFVLHKKK